MTQSRSPCLSTCTRLRCKLVSFKATAKYNIMSLRIEDKQQVLVLYTARDKWRFIGSCLNVANHDLRSIATEESSNEGRLDRMIARWLQGGQNCTWEAVAAALRNITVDRPDLARELEEDHSVTPPHTSGECEVGGIYTVTGVRIHT